MFNNRFEKSRVLITGDTGFKGSWLSIWLKLLGADVYGYALPPRTERDNYVTCGLENIIHHQDGDIRDHDALLDYFNFVRPDFAFHLAAQPLVIESFHNPHYTFETNLMGTVNFFEAVRKTDSIKSAVNVTSDKCYSNSEWVWGYRECDPMGGKDPYSASKSGSEIITLSYLNSFFTEMGTTSIASARAGNVIGGGDWADNRIFPDFFRALEAGEVLELRNPDSTRPWQHVLEPLSGYLSLAMNLSDHGKGYGGGWNFGPIGDASKSVRELVEEMIISLGKGQFTAPQAKKRFHEAGLLNLDISKAMHELNWIPALDFGDTVRMAVEGFSIDDCDDVHLKRIAQIHEYTNIAQSKNIKWSL
jgi:CDP-glucose 4,6-dehydratase